MTYATEVNRPESVTDWAHSELAALPMSLVVRIWLRAVRLLTALRFFPSIERIPDVPLATRLSLIHI